MRVASIDSVVLTSTPLRKKTECNTQMEFAQNNESTPQLSKFSTVSFLSQMPNINFKGRYNYGKDDLSDYNNYSGPQPPELEIKKYRISCKVDNAIAEDNYLEAIKGKLELAKICRWQGKERDTFILEESIRRLYKDLPRYQRGEAKSAIRPYNEDMANYIDKDILNY